MMVEVDDKSVKLCCLESCMPMGMSPFLWQNRICAYLMHCKVW